MENKWIETVTEIDTVNWRGEPIHLTGVKALKNSRTGRIQVFPYDVAKAEVESIANEFDILPRDVSSLLMIQAKPGIFKEGEVLFKYHLQKMLFYLWKDLGRNGYGEALPRDNFVAAENGPVPEQLNEDLERFEKNDWIITKYEKWEQGVSKRIILTEKGAHLTRELWNSLPEPYKIVALKVKEQIFPLDPEKVRHLVHMEFPEYKDSYIKNDIE